MSTLIDTLIHETSVSTGTGDFTVAAANARRRFSDGWSTGGTDVFYYSILNRDANEWEYGTGHLSATSTLVRDTVIKSSNANALVSFSAGDKDVLNDLPAENQLSVADAAAAYQPLDTDLTSWAAVVRAAGFDTFVATPSLANLGSLLTNEAAGAMTFLTTPTLANFGSLLTDDPTGLITFMTTPTSANFAALVTDDLFSLADVELGAIAGLTSAADKFPYFTGSGTAALADLSSATRTFLTTPSSANLAALISDDLFSLADAELGAIAGLTSAADKGIYFTGSGTAALFDMPSAMRTFHTTPSSANLISLVTDETGSGSLVFATSPGFTTAANPISNDGAALGTTSLGWSDLFLADGGVVNWGNGGVTQTHTAASDSLTVSLDSGNALGSTFFNVDVDGARTICVTDTGICFNADTAAANALDDYEEGTYTAVVTGSGSNPTITYTTREGNYTKIGNVVFVQCFVRINTYSGGTGDLRISLPFTQINGSFSLFYPTGACLTRGVAWAASKTYVVAEVTNNAAYVQFNEVQTNAASSTLAVTNVAAADEFSFTVTMWV